MAHQPEHGTNRPYYVDIIPFRLNRKLPEFDEIRPLYLEKGLSSARLAKQYGVARSSILKVLHEGDVRLGNGGHPHDALQYLMLGAGEHSVVMNRFQRNERRRSPVMAQGADYDIFGL